jgi:hypothetical protein
MKYQFDCDYEECHKVSDVDLDDEKMVETIHDQDGKVQYYIVTCPHCGVRQAVVAWKFHDKSP